MQHLKHTVPEERGRLNSFSFTPCIQMTRCNSCSGWGWCRNCGWLRNANSCQGVLFVCPGELDKPYRNGLRSFSLSWESAFYLGLTRDISWGTELMSPLKCPYPNLQIYGQRSCIDGIKLQTWHGERASFLLYSSCHTTTRAWQWCSWERASQLWRWGMKRSPVRSSTEWGNWTDKKDCRDSSEDKSTCGISMRTWLWNPSTLM